MSGIPPTEDDTKMVGFTNQLFNWCDHDSQWLRTKNSTLIFERDEYLVIYWFHHNTTLAWSVEI